MPQPLRFARCCYTAVIALDGAALPQSSHRAVLLCTVIALCGAALPQSLRFALCRYTTVIASCGAGSAMPQSSLRAVLGPYALAIA